MEEENNPPFQMMMEALAEAVRAHLIANPQLLDAYNTTKEVTD